MHRSFPMTIIPQVAEAMQTVLDTIAYRLGRTGGLVQRECTLTAASFVERLLFSFLANPEATGAELTQTAAALGVTISESGLTQRFTPQAASLLASVLAEAIKRVLAAESLDIALISQSSAVYLEDSTVVVLPEALHELWRGCGNARNQATAALKLTLRVDLRTGLLDGLSLNSGRTADTKAAAPLTSIAAGALYLADLGFFGLKRLRRLAVQGAFFLWRLHAQVTLFTADGQRWDDVAALLATKTEAALDLAVELGVDERLKARLVAVRAPQEVVDQRRRRLRSEATRRGRTLSARQLALAAWTLFVTNVPAEQLSIKAVLVMARTGWHIELVFERSKSQGNA